MRAYVTALVRIYEGSTDDRIGRVNIYSSLDFAAAHRIRAKRALKRSGRKSGDPLRREVVQVAHFPALQGARGHAELRG